MGPVSDTQSLGLEGKLYIRVTLNRNLSILIAFNAIGPEYLFAGYEGCYKIEHYWSFHLYTEVFCCCFLKLVVFFFSF